jgi:hypothetical protein
MKKISNITQTYFTTENGERNREIDSFLSDDNIFILRLLDIVTFSFHNCKSDFIKKSKIKILNKVPNCIFFEFNNMSYTECMIEYIKKLKKLDVTHFLFWQDDMIVVKNKLSKTLFFLVYNHYKHDNNMDYLKLFNDDIFHYLDIFNKTNVYYDFDTNNLKIYVKNTSDLKQHFLIDKDNYIFYTKTYTDQPYLMSIICVKNMYLM